MKYKPHVDDNEITTLRITKKIRRKLGYLVDHNETLDTGLEKILDIALEKLA